MARKKTEFSWVRDEPEVEPPEDEAEEAGPGRPERSEHRAHMLDLKTLANRLANVSRGLRRTLPMDEELQAQLDLLEAADGRVDRRRVLMRAKLLLGRADVPRIEAALAGETDAVARERELVAWRARILAGDDREVQAFVEVYPRADRQAIRARAREGRREGPRATAAQVRLLRLLREGAAASDGGDGGPESGAP